MDDIKAPTTIIIVERIEGARSLDMVGYGSTYCMYCRNSQRHKYEGEIVKTDVPLQVVVLILLRFLFLREGN